MTWPTIWLKLTCFILPMCKTQCISKSYSKVPHLITCQSLDSDLGSVIGLRLHGNCHPGGHWSKCLERVHQTKIIPRKSETKLESFYKFSQGGYPISRAYSIFGVIWLLLTKLIFTKEFGLDEWVGCLKWKDWFKTDVCCE